jgi:hypothetical protein
MFVNPFSVCMYCSLSIAGQCRTTVIRNQRYRTDPDAGMPIPDWEKMPIPIITFSWHLLMLFQNHIVRILPSAAVYGRAGCMTFHHQQLRRAACIPFHWQQYGRAGCILFTTTNASSIIDVQGVSLSATSCMGSSLHHQQYGRAGYLFLPPAVLTCKLHTSLSLAVRTCNVFVSLFTLF